MLEEYKKQFKNKGEIYLRVKVLPGSSKNEAREILEDGTIKIGIAATPEKNKANQELIKFLAKEFDIKKNNIKILSGKTERIKLIKIWI